MSTVDGANQVPIVELDGLGHDAFEEDEERFCKTVDQLLSTLWNDKNEA